MDERLYCPPVPSGTAGFDQGGGEPAVGSWLGRAVPGRREPLLPYEAQLESLILFRWDRVYPADTCLDIPLEEHGWRLVERSEFPGYSHEKIVQEVYQK